MYEPPRYDVDVRIEVNPEKLEWPRSDVRALGRRRNLTFHSLLSIEWDYASEVADAEHKLLAECRTAEDHDSFEDLYVAITDSDDAMHISGGLDFGVVGACLCLNAAGCYTFYSCSGHEHGEGYPYVCFWVRPGALPVLLAAAEEARVGLIDGREGCGEVFSDRFDGLAAFAAALLKRRAALEVLPLALVTYELDRDEEDEEDAELASVAEEGD